MAEIIKVLREHLPACTFIGKRYTESDRINGNFSAHWERWFACGWFERLERLGSLPENGDAYIGLMSCDGEWGDFCYSIGMFLPLGTKAPDGFIAIDMPESDIGVCYIYGKDDGSLYTQDQACCAKFAEAGMWPPREIDGRKWFFERYNCPRFTTPDDKGNVILDYCVYC